MLPARSPIWFVVPGCAVAASTPVSICAPAKTLPVKPGAPVAGRKGETNKGAARRLLMRCAFERQQASDNPGNLFFAVPLSC